MYVHTVPLLMLLRATSFLFSFTPPLSYSVSPPSPPIYSFFLYRMYTLFRFSYSFALLPSDSPSLRLFLVLSHLLPLYVPFVSLPTLRYLACDKRGSTLIDSVVSPFCDDVYRGLPWSVIQRLQPAQIHIIVYMKSCATDVYRGLPMVRHLTRRSCSITLRVLMLLSSNDVYCGLPMVRHLKAVTDALCCSC